MNREFKRKNDNLYESLLAALKGLYVVFLRERNLKIHVLAFLIVMFAAAYFQVSVIEWALIIIVSGMVIVSEIINSAIELTIDLVTKKESIRAKIAKDAAAGAVLISTLIAIVIGLFIFYNRLVGGS